RCACKKRALPAFAGVFRKTLPAPPPGGEFSFQGRPGNPPRRVRHPPGLEYTLGEIEALALGEVERVGDLLTHACAKFGRRQSADKIIAEIRASWRPEKPLLELYRQKNQQIADAFRAAGAVTFPTGDRLDVRPGPDFMRALFP